MANVLKAKPTPKRHGIPVAEVYLASFPLQGDWTKEQYLDLDLGRHVEFDNGFVQVFPMPDEVHQAIVETLFVMLRAFAGAADLGTVRIAPHPMQTHAGRFREPDIMFMSKRHRGRRTGTHWQGADLMIEVISGSRADRTRDLKDKRLEYAKTRVPEHWIVDPKNDTIRVLVLAGGRYVEHGVFKRNAAARSRLLKGFEVPVGPLFDMARS